MKLEKLLDVMGSFEKNAFIKTIETILSNKPQNLKEIERILSSSDRGIKSADNQNIAKIFSMVESEYMEIIKTEFRKTSTQLDIVIDIVIKDGHGIIKQDWFSRLYDNELKMLKQKITQLQTEIEDDKSEIGSERKRDYKVYKACLRTAYKNDEKNNQESKITNDELSILHTISKELELSQEEVKLINYTVIPVVKQDIDTIIESLRSVGIIFFAKKTSTIYVSDEMVRLLRKVRKKEIADKFSRRVLRLLREPQINLICKKHNIDRKLLLADKIKEIINVGVSLTDILTQEIHKEGLSLTEKKKFLNEFCDKSLNINPALKGSTLDEKMSNLIHHFEAIEKDDRVGISLDGYEKLLLDLGETLPKLVAHLRKVLEFQEEDVLKIDYLLDRNLKPADILDLIPDTDLELFCVERGIKTRGERISNILENYKDAENLYLENYENIAYRKLNELKECGIVVKEAELGLKFEELTKTIFMQLGFHCDEESKKKLNTTKDKMDILINLGNNEIIIIECKTIKENGYNKFSAVSRQLKAYKDLSERNGFKVVKSLLVAPEFSDDFISECELDFELNLSLLTASSLARILDGFKTSAKHKQFPHVLFRDVLINEDRILKALGK
jgi:hypothetical protein